MKNVSKSLSLALLVALVLLLSSCATKKKVRALKPARIGSSTTGIASWYGDPYHGRRAANGEIYNMEAMTAAHQTLPFGTWVRVKNLTNDRTVDVRIQDRGPFVGKRIIDLSRAAAREIEMLGPGTAKVKLTVIAPKNIQQPASVITAAAQAELFAVQIGAFQDRVKADALAASMKELYGAARVVVREARPPLFRVLVGEEDSMERANALSERLRAAGADGFVVRLDVITVPN